MSMLSTCQEKIFILKCIDYLIDGESWEVSDLYGCDNVVETLLYEYSSGIEFIEEKTGRPLRTLIKEYRTFVDRIVDYYFEEQIKIYNKMRFPGYF